MASTTKNYVLFEILRKNDYATTKSDTYYTMTGTTQSGWVVDNIFGSDSRRQAINSSKLVTPVGKHSIRILPGATAETEALDPQQQHPRDGRPRDVGEDGPERRSREMGGILRPDSHLVPYDPRTDIQVQVHVDAAAPQRAAQSTEPGSEPGLGEIVNSKKFRR